MNPDPPPPEPAPGDRPDNTNHPFGVTTYSYSSFAATKGLCRRERRLAA